MCDNKTERPTHIRKFHKKVNKLIDSFLNGKEEADEITTLKEEFGEINPTLNYWKMLIQVMNIIKNNITSKDGYNPS